jgi:mannosyl-oligosaccharide alpha-1,2-mannosidase
MFRYRRYRVFLVLASLTIFLLYRMTHSASTWDSEAITNVIVPNHFVNSNYRSDKESEARKDQSADEPYIPDPRALPPESAQKIRPDPYLSIPKPTQRVPPEHPKDESGAAKEKSSGSVAEQPKVNHEDVDNGLNDGTELILAEGGQGRMPQDHIPTATPVERWTSRPDHFPVPTESIIPLPTGKGKKIPKIQADFKTENDEDKTIRLQRLDQIKEAFQHAWHGYKTYAWGKDELKPLSGSSKNTFNGWSATLVDSLDTMWIMGLKEEFEEAVEFVKTIDFHTSQRLDIPLFETTIRYLGGLIGAYDVSEAKYPVLLEKATMLGDILMGAFDTPNRMPQTFFTWRGAFTSQPHRAPPRVVLAEIGSLQMEFTRLAQLTGNNTYYDAITRIMNALEEWQDHTGIPGLWPADIDTSGCNTTIIANEGPVTKPDTTFINSKGEGKSYLVDTGPPVAQGNGDEPSKSPDTIPLEKPEPLVFKVKEESKNLRKRQVGNIPTDRPEVPPNSVPDSNLILAAGHHEHEFSVPRVSAISTDDLPACTPKGLDYTISGWARYTLGSTADSAFEYLSKMHLLLNGQTDNYRSMFEKAMDAANDKLIFRIMIPNSKREVYSSGELAVTDVYQVGNTFKPEVTHLTCFVGGMFAMGARIFDRPSDLDIAAKLTDGCVWAYENSASGIMPESMHVTKCESRKSCPWNETQWFVDIDPNAESRENVYKDQMDTYNSQVRQQMLKTATRASPSSTSSANAAIKATASPTSDARGIVTGPQEGERAPPKGFDPHARPPMPKVVKHTDSKKPEDIDAPKPLKKRTPPGYRQPAYKPGVKPSPTVEDESAFTPPTLVDTAPAIWSPDKVMSREEFAKSRIEEERLSPGIKQIQDPRYLLRYVSLTFITRFALLCFDQR